MKHRSLVTLAALLATTLGGTAALAQAADQTPAPQPSAPQQAPMNGQGMMQGQGMMGQMSNMQAQMNKMMNDCGAMMQRAMQAPPASAAAPQQKG